MTSGWEAGSSHGSSMTSGREAASPPGGGMPRPRLGKDTSMTLLPNLRFLSLVTLGALVAACGGPAIPAPRNPSDACRPGAPAPTSTTSPGWPCWPEGLTPADASIDITSEGDVAARPEVVWAWLTRADLWTTWFPRATNVRFEHGGPTLEVGTVVVWNMLGSTIRVTIVRAEAPNVLAWEGGAGGVHAYHAWLIEPRGDGSHVVTVETERGVLPGLFGWTFKGSLSAAHDEWVAGLARVAGQGAMPSKMPSKMP